MKRVAFVTFAIFLVFNFFADWIHVSRTVTSSEVTVSVVLNTESVKRDSYLIYTGISGVSEKLRRSFSWK